MTEVNWTAYSVSRHCYMIHYSLFNSVPVSRREHLIIVWQPFMLNTIRCMLQPHIWLEGLRAVGISLQPVLQWRHYVFAFCVAASDLPMPNIFLLLHKNTEHIRRMQSLPRTDYKWLHFGRKWNGDKGARYNSNWCQSHYTDYGSCNRRHNFMLI